MSTNTLELLEHVMNNDIHQKTGILRSCCDMPPLAPASAYSTPSESLYDHLRPSESHAIGLDMPSTLFNDPIGLSTNRTAARELRASEVAERDGVWLATPMPCAAGGNEPRLHPLLYAESGSDAVLAGWTLLPPTAEMLATQIGIAAGYAATGCSSTRTLSSQSPAVLPTTLSNGVRRREHHLLNERAATEGVQPEVGRIIDNVDDFINSQLTVLANTVLPPSPALVSLQSAAAAAAAAAAAPPPPAEPPHYASMRARLSVDELTAAGIPLQPPPPPPPPLPPHSFTAGAALALAMAGADVTAQIVSLLCDSVVPSESGPSLNSTSTLLVALGVTQPKGPQGAALNAFIPSCSQSQTELLHPILVSSALLAHGLRNLSAPLSYNQTTICLAELFTQRAKLVRGPPATLRSALPATASLETMRRAAHACDTGDEAFVAPAALQLTAELADDLELWHCSNLSFGLSPEVAVSLATLPVTTNDLAGGLDDYSSDYKVADVPVIPNVGWLSDESTVVSAGVALGLVLSGYAAAPVPEQNPRASPPSPASDAAAPIAATESAGITRMLASLLENEDPACQNLPSYTDLGEAAAGGIHGNVVGLREMVVKFADICELKMDLPSHEAVRDQWLHFGAAVMPGEGMAVTGARAAAAALALGIAHARLPSNTPPQSAEIDLATMLQPCRVPSTALFASNAAAAAPRSFATELVLAEPSRTLPLLPKSFICDLGHQHMSSDERRTAMTALGAVVAAAVAPSVAAEVTTTTPTHPLSEEYSLIVLDSVAGSLLGRAVVAAGTAHPSLSLATLLCAETLVNALEKSYQTPGGPALLLEVPLPYSDDEMLRLHAPTSATATAVGWIVHACALLLAGVGAARLTPLLNRIHELVRRTRWPLLPPDTDPTREVGAAGFIPLDLHARAAAAAALVTMPRALQPRGRVGVALLAAAVAPMNQGLTIAPSTDLFAQLSFEITRFTLVHALMAPEDAPVYQAAAPNSVPIIEYIFDNDGTLRVPLPAPLLRALDAQTTVRIAGKGVNSTQLHLSDILGMPLVVCGGNESAWGKETPEPVFGGVDEMRVIAQSSSADMLEAALNAVRADPTNAPTLSMFPNWTIKLN